MGSDNEDGIWRGVRPFCRRPVHPFQLFGGSIANSSSKVDGKAARTRKTNSGTHRISAGTMVREFFVRVGCLLKEVGPSYIRKRIRRRVAFRGKDETYNANLPIAPRRILSLNSDYSNLGWELKFLYLIHIAPCMYISGSVYCPDMPIRLFPSR
jgi:hypothetical protein